jgi:hypothetical protein
MKPKLLYFVFDQRGVFGLDLQAQFNDIFEKFEVLESLENHRLENDELVQLFHRQEGVISKSAFFVFDKISLLLEAILLH